MHRNAVHHFVNTRTVAKWKACSAMGSNAKHVLLEVVFYARRCGISCNCMHEPAKKLCAMSRDAETCENIWGGCSSSQIHGAGQLWWRWWDRELQKLPTVEDDLSVHRWIIIPAKFEIRRVHAALITVDCLELRQIGGCFWLEGICCFCCHSALHAGYTDLSLLESTMKKIRPPQNGILLRRCPWPEGMLSRVAMRASSRGSLWRILWFSPLGSVILIVKAGGVPVSVP